MSYESLIRQQLPEQIQKLLRRFGKTGDEMGVQVFVVGGFVRDLLIGRPNLDVDVVVEGDGIEFARAFAEGKGDVRCHRRFGTAVVTLSSCFKVDIATARTETYEHPGALPTVKPGTTIKEDLRRRDFTINAMAIDLTPDRFGELVDFFDGQVDLLDGLVRVLHDLSFIDDPTRIFRAVKYEQRYGFRMESTTENLLRKAVSEGYIQSVSGQRIRNEILLIMGEEDPIPTILRMAELDLLEHIHPDIEISTELFQRVREIMGWWETISAHRNPDAALLNLMALVDSLTLAEVEDVSKRLALRRKHADSLRLSKTHLPDVLRFMSKKTIQPSHIYSTLKGLPLEVLLFAMSRYPELYDNISMYIERLQKIRPFVSGSDLRRLGYSEGPLYSRILERAFAAQLDGEIKNRDQAIEFVRERFPLENKHRNLQQEQISCS